MEEKSPAVYIDETVYDGQSEQGVELDYVLPDYCPDIFKILSCTFTPKILSSNVSADLKLNLEGIVYVKTLYLSENSKDVHCIDQRYTYSKLIDIGRNLSDVTVDSNSLRLNLAPKSDYCNCRAISPRRIDIRGAVSVRIKAAAPISHPLFAVDKISDPPEIRTREIACCGKTLFSEKQIVVREEIDTGAVGIGFIMESSAVPKVTDLRIVADKAVLKGVITVTALYGLYDENSSGCSKTEKMSADIPISAILDIEGISDGHLSVPQICVMNTELTPKTDSGIISAELLVNCSLKGIISETISVVTDAYSVDYETEITSSHLRIFTNPRTVKQTFSLKTALSYNDGDIRSVWDCSAELKNPVCRPNSEGSLVLSGTLCVAAYGTNNEDLPFFIEKSEPVEQIISAENIFENSTTDFTVNISDTGFSIQSGNSLEVTATVDFSAVVTDMQNIDAVSSVNLLEDKPKEKNSDYSLRICFTGENANCWDIAKRYNTTVKALMEDNNIEDINEPLSGMIIIPTV